MKTASCPHCGGKGQFLHVFEQADFYLCVKCDKHFYIKWGPPKRAAKTRRPKCSEQ